MTENDTMKLSTLFLLSFIAANIVGRNLAGTSNSNDLGPLGLIELIVLF
jgi:hypothetical protein